jgi:hypothetical protein
MHRISTLSRFSAHRRGLSARQWLIGFRIVWRRVPSPDSIGGTCTCQDSKRTRSLGIGLSREHHRLGDHHRCLVCSIHNDEWRFIRMDGTRRRRRYAWDPIAARPIIISVESSLSSLPVIGINQRLLHTLSTHVDPRIWSHKPDEPVQKNIQSFSHAIQIRDHETRDPSEVWPSEQSRSNYKPNNGNDKKSWRVRHLIFLRRSPAVN